MITLLKGSLSPLGVGSKTAHDPIAGLGPKLYLRAEAVIGVTTGDPVASWSDASGNAHHAVQATASKRPTWIAAGIGGMPSVRFDGVDDSLEIISPLVASGAPRTILTVGKDMGTKGGTIVTFRGSSPVFATQIAYVTPKVYVYTDAVTAANNASVSDVRTTVNSPFIAVHRSAGAGSKVRFRLNGAAETVAQTGSVSPDTGTAGTRIGSREDGFGQPWSGDFALIAVIDADLPDADVAAVEADLAAIYGITLA